MIKKYKDHKRRQGAKLSVYDIVWAIPLGLIFIGPMIYVVFFVEQNKPQPRSAYSSSIIRRCEDYLSRRFVDVEDPEYGACVSLLSSLEDPAY